MPADRDEGNESHKRKKPGRTPTACAECRRLKFKCDRQVPCSRCVSRGCNAICPDGTLARKGSRLILSSTVDLEVRIDVLTSRIHALEVALRILQDTHPLLSSECLAIKFPPNSAEAEAASSQNRESSVAGPEQGSRELNSVISQWDESRPQTNESGCDSEGQPVCKELGEAFGTLSLGSAGQSAFIGRTARPEFLIDALSKSTNSMAQRPELIPTKLSPAVVNATFTENEQPFQHNIKQEVYDHLPPLSEATRLCDCYLKSSEWLYFAPIKRSEIYDQVIAHVYTHEVQRRGCPHSVALLFIMLALGSLYDETKPTDPGLSRDYFYCARATLSFISPLKHATVMSVQTLSHMSLFLYQFDYELLTDTPAWGYIGLATQLATSIGLHLNNERWNLSPEEVERRSRVFWSIFCLDICISFSIGRPPNVTPAFMDCPVPAHLEVVLPDGRREPNFHAWTFGWTVFLHEVMTKAFGANIPAYPEIVELDRRIRDFRIPEHLRVQCSLPGVGNSILLMQWYWVLAAKEETLLNLHRSHFALALREMPSDPLKHKYAASVLAAYRSSWRLVETLKLSWDRPMRIYVAKVSLPWSLALSGCLALGLLVVRAPDTALAKTALETLDAAETLFTSAAPICRAAAKHLSHIRVIREKAYSTALKLNAGPDASLLHNLESLGGKTQLLRRLSSTERDPSQDSYSVHNPTSDLADLATRNTNTLSSMQPLVIDDTGLSALFSEPLQYPYGYGNNNPFLETDLPANPENLHRRIVQDMTQAENTTDLFNLHPSNIAEALQDTDWNDSPGLEGFVFDYNALNMEYFQNEGLLPAEMRTHADHRNVWDPQS